MIKVIVLLSSLFLLSVNSIAQKQYRVIAVGSYNVENMFDTINDTTKEDEDFTPNGAYHYSETVYKQKLHNIATVIAKMGTDVTPDGAAIIGIVEVENDKVLSDLVNQPELKNRHYKYVWFPTPDVRGISTAMLYNPKYMTILSSRPIRVPLETLGQARPTRDVLYVCGIMAGDTVHILVNHWPSKSGGEAASAPGRRLAATVDKKIIDSLLSTNPDSKILALGDLNDNPTSDGVRRILQAKADKNDVGITDIYNPWINMYKKGLGTESYRGEWNLIDQIMVSGALIKNNNKKWQYYKSEIFNPDFITNRLGKDVGLPHRSFTITQSWDNGYSDHFPVLVYLIEEQQ